MMILNSYLQRVLQIVALNCFFFEFFKISEYSCNKFASQI